MDNERRKKTRGLWIFGGILFLMLAISLAFLSQKSSEGMLRSTKQSQKTQDAKSTRTAPSQTKKTLKPKKLRLNLEKNGLWNSLQTWSQNQVNEDRFGLLEGIEISAAERSQIIFLYDAEGRFSGIRSGDLEKHSHLKTKKLYEEITEMGYFYDLAIEATDLNKEKTEAIREVIGRLYGPFRKSSDYTWSIESIRFDHLDQGAGEGFVFQLSKRSTRKSSRQADRIWEMFTANPNHIGSNGDNADKANRFFALRVAEPIIDKENKNQQ